MLSVIIPVYKNEELFLANFQHNHAFLQNYEIIVVNDDPQKSLKSKLENYKNIILIENKTNLGFGRSINTGVKKASGDFIMLLNSDVLLKDDDFISAIPKFGNNKRLFAVSFAQVEKNNKIVGKNTIYWKRGFFYHKISPNIIDGINAWAEGGSCIIDRNKFLQLGGFDELYSPFYWEDVDLSYRAWKAGYQIFYDSRVVVEHHHESTIGKYFSKGYINEIAFRNQLIFIWKNITDTNLIIDHFSLLVLSIIRFLVGSKTDYLKGFFKAAAKAPDIITRRRNQAKMHIFNDYQILKKFHE